MNFVPKIEVEVAVGDDPGDRVFDCIQRTAHTGRLGDGKIFVYDLGSAVRIRTGKPGNRRHRRR